MNETETTLSVEADAMPLDAIDLGGGGIATEADAPPEEPAPPATPVAAGSQRSLQRAAYILVFLLTTLAVYSVWPQAGGQGHLDAMPWYWKLFPPLLFSGAVMRASVAACEQAEGSRRRTLWWAAVALLIAGLIGGVTYYYHLQEAAESVDSDEGIMTNLMAPPRQTDVYQNL